MRRPTLIEGVVGEDFVSEDDIFQAVLEAVRENRGARRDSGMQIFVQNATLVSNLGKVVPVAEDRCFEGYAARLRREHGIGEFGLQIDNVHLRNPSVMTKVMPVFRRVCDHVGIPMTGAYVDAFIGNYACTPFGVHRDPVHDFMFMIKGQRRMRLWSPEAAAACGIEERLLDYRDHVGTGLQIDARRDSIIYWPPSYWHVGESTGLSVSMNVNFMGASQTADDWTNIAPLLNLIRRQKPCRSMRPFPAFARFQASQRSGELPVPDSLHEAIHRIREACTSQSFARTVVAEWLAHLSREGFVTEHRRRTSQGQAALARDAVVRARVPLYWTRHEGCLLWACQGRSGELDGRNGADRLLGRLAAGAPVHVSALLGESDTTHLRAFLEELVTIGALECLAPERLADAQVAAG